MNLDVKLRTELGRYVDNMKDNVETGVGMWMVGPVGTGKSAAAAMLAKEANALDLQAAFWSLSRLLSRLREGYHPDSEYTPQQLIDELVGGIDLLVLDDVGVPRATEWALEALHDLLDALYLNENAVIVTSDLDEEGFDKRFEERLGSRLSELCGRPMRFEGADLRRLRPAA